jgi:hypothetical protein
LELYAKNISKKALYTVTAPEKGAVVLGIEGFFTENSIPESFTEKVGSIKRLLKIYFWKT